MLSPCVDAGNPNIELDPDGTRADIGAYPFYQIPGCLDPLADNYNEDANANDVSCIGSPVVNADFTYAGEFEEKYYYLVYGDNFWHDAKVI